MISEKEFSRQFLGFWSECVPFLDKSLVAELNLQGSAMPDNKGFVVKPMVSSLASSENDIVAETAFGIFAAAKAKQTRVRTIAADRAEVDLLTDHASSRISQLRRLSYRAELGSDESRDDAVELALRMEWCFDQKDCKQLVIQPRFKGCGILNSCFGDVLCDDCLCEIKMVNRNLLGVDLRQVIAYCALNYQSHQYSIRTISIINPRRGIEYHFEVEALIQRASGKNSAELFHQLTDFLSNFEAIQHAN